jgi:hypothetical protein
LSDWLPPLDYAGAGVVPERSLRPPRFGEGMRCLRIGRDATYVCGLGVSNLSGIVSLTNPGTLRLIRNEDRTVLVTTDAGLSLTRDWLGGTAQRIEVLTLDDEWMDVTHKCHDNNIPPSWCRLVRNPRSASWSNSGSHPKLINAA